MPTFRKSPRRSGTRRSPPARAKRSPGAKVYHSRTVPRTPRAHVAVSQKSGTVGAVRRYSGRRRTSRSLGSRWGNPLSQQKSVKFLYADTGFNLDTQGSLGIFATSVWRGNSVFDPHESGVGVQPYGYDALCNATNYGITRVVASKIVVTFYPLIDVTQAISNIVFTVVPSIASALTYTSTDDLRVMPYAKQVHWSEVRAPFTITNYCTNRQIFGCAVPGSDAAEAANWNSTPPSKWRWHVFADSTAASEDVEIRCDVKIYYYTQLVRVDDQNES